MEIQSVRQQMPSTGQIYEKMPLHGNLALYSTPVELYRNSVYYILLKTESLDNAILAFWLAQPLWHMSYYTMLSVYGRCTRQFKIGS